MTGGQLKMTVDKDALPREIKEKADKLKTANVKMKKAVIQKKKSRKTFTYLCLKLKAKQMLCK